MVSLYLIKMKHKFIKLEKCELGTMQQRIELLDNSNWNFSMFPYPEFGVSNIGVANPDLTDKTWCAGVWSQEIPCVRQLVTAFALIQ